MALQGLRLQAIMNSFIKSYAEEQTSKPDVTAVRLFSLSVKSLSSCKPGSAAVSAKDAVSRHHKRKVEELKGAHAAAGSTVDHAMGQAAYSHQALRLKALTSELRRCSLDQLKGVRDARTARRVCRMFQLPDDAFDSWHESFQQSKRSPAKRRGTGSSPALSPSPSPTKRRGKRKSPDRAAAAAAVPPSRLGPAAAQLLGLEEEGSTVPVPVRRRSNSPDDSRQFMAPRQLFAEGLAAADASCGSSTGCAEAMEVDDGPLREPSPGPASMQYQQQQWQQRQQQQTIPSSSGSGRAGSTHPEWEVFRQHVAPPSPGRPPLRPLHELAVAPTGQVTPPASPQAAAAPLLSAPAPLLAAGVAVEQACSDAVHKLRMANAILAGQASPGTLLAAAAALPAAHELQCSSPPRSSSSSSRLQAPPAVTPPNRLPPPTCLLLKRSPVAAAVAKREACALSKVARAGAAVWRHEGVLENDDQRQEEEEEEDAALAAAAADIMMCFGSAPPGSVSDGHSFSEWQEEAEASARSSLPWQRQPRSTASAAGSEARMALSRQQQQQQEEEEVQQQQGEEDQGEQETHVVGPWHGQQAPLLPKGILGASAGSRLMLMEERAVQLFAEAPALQAGVAGAEQALRALNVRGRAHSIAKPLQLEARLSSQGPVYQALAC